VDARYNLGQAMARQGRLDEAIEHYRTAIRIKPQFFEAWNDKKEVYVEIGADKIPVYYIGLPHLIQNKKVADRPRDREDVKFLLKIKHD